MLRADGKTGEAAGELGKFAEHLKTNHDGEIEVWAWLGLLRDESGDWISGEAAHRKAVALAPGREIAAPPVDLRGVPSSASSLAATSVFVAGLGAVGGSKGKSQRS